MNKYNSKWTFFAFHTKKHDSTNSLWQFSGKDFCSLVFLSCNYLSLPRAAKGRHCNEAAKRKGLAAKPPCRVRGHTACLGLPWLTSMLTSSGSSNKQSMTNGIWDLVEQWTLMTRLLFCLVLVFFLVRPSGVVLKYNTHMN